MADKVTVTLNHLWAPDRFAAETSSKASIDERIEAFSCRCTTAVKREPLLAWRQPPPQRVTGE